ncbi:hypothetical protein KQ306_00955 [Synechococcus sp. CS-1324]|nr:hypothetical protein [Synechococcus sp. CS-1326]MCT0229433.1 hypothetical protein [Synechococcus sp. CS-1324]MCT0232915.1 hypothetical protein [Synechococcus sp. CS-1327]PZV04987.1 MAG: hypothetical protein DCF23_04635 [Cyanobium sp.]
MLLWLGLGLAALPAALSEPQRLELRCRREQGPWQACVMRIEAIGERWSLELGGQRLDFRHDGSGKVEMQQKSRGPWGPVSSHWSKDQALCWGTVCALGQIPLD